MERRTEETQNIQKSTNPIVDTLHSMTEQAKAALANLNLSSGPTSEPAPAQENTWWQPFQDAKGTVVGKANYTGEDAMDDAVRLRRGMKGLGTDKATIVDITGHRTFYQRRMIVKEYANIDKEKRDLLHDLKNDVGGDLENLVLPLYMIEGEFDAFLMEKAMRGIGNDVEVLNEILCTRSNSQIKAMKQAWKEKINNKQSLEDRVADETKKFFGVTHYHNLCLRLLEAKRPACAEPNEKEVLADAEELNRVLLERSNVNTAEAKFVEIFTERSWPHIRALIGAFENVSKKWTLDGAICHEFGESSNTVKALRVIIEFSTDPYDFWAKRLRDAMKGLGIDDSKLIRIVVSRCEIDMANIVQVFGRKYGDGKTLKNWFEKDCSGFYGQLLSNLCGYY